MKLKFWGADKSVTGSCHCLEVNGKMYLIDCGLEQGEDEKNNENQLNFDPKDIEAVLLTHAHMDHSGRLPLLVKLGFTGPIITTTKTEELLDIMLRDSAHIQETEAEWKNRKQRRAGEEPEEPLYTQEDVENTLPLIRPIRYHETIQVGEGVTAEFIDAGHLLGAATIRVHCEEDGVTKDIVFSGDIGNTDQPLIKDPEYFHEADIVLMETTYGNRVHDRETDYTELFAKIIDETLGHGGNVVIPAFAVGRTQHILYYLREIKNRGMVHSVPNFKVYVDSPLAQRATEIYDKDMEEYCDDETKAVLRSGNNPILFRDLYLTSSTADSVALNTDPEPKVILSASGMCDAGRIRHHLKHNLWRKECSIVFVGYQAGGTLGRSLVDGTKSVRLFGESIAVNANIINIHGMSGHADRPGLLRWLHEFTDKPEKVFLIHGEETAMQSFYDEITTEGYVAYMPNFACEYDIATETITKIGVQREIVRKTKETKAYARLLDIYGRMGDLVNKNREYTNKDISKLARALEDVYRKFGV